MVVHFACLSCYLAARGGLVPLFLPLPFYPIDLPLAIVLIIDEFLYFVDVCFYVVLFTHAFDVSECCPHDLVLVP